jgi:hypothetical protein
MKVHELVEKWRKDAEFYRRQVEEARANQTPHDMMLAGMSFLRQCAKELEAAISADPNKQG